MFNRVEADMLYSSVYSRWTVCSTCYKFWEKTGSNEACSVKATDTLEYRGFTTFEYFQRPPTDKRASVIDDTFLTKLKYLSRCTKTQLFQRIRISRQKCVGEKYIRDEDI